MQRVLGRISEVIWFVFFGLIFLASAVVLISYKDALQLALTFNSFFLIFSLSFVTRYLDTVLGLGLRVIIFPIAFGLGYAPLDIVLAMFSAGLVSSSLTLFIHNKVGNINITGNILYRRAAILMGIPLSIGIVLTTLAMYYQIEIMGSFVLLLIGISLFFIGTYILFTNFFYTSTSKQVSPIFLLGIGLTGTIANIFANGGIIITSAQVALSIREKDALAVSVLCQVLSCLAGILVALILGGEYVRDIALPALLGGLLGILPGVFTVKSLSAEVLRRSIGYAALAVGTFCIYQFFPYILE